MATARIDNPAHWRALLGLLWRTGRWRMALFVLLILVVGLLPTGVILLTGDLVRAIPAAVRDGVWADGGEPARLALAGLLTALAALSLGTTALNHLSRRMDADFALEVHQTVAAVMLGTPGLAPLDDPALADELQAVQEAERREALRRTAMAISNVAVTRLRGMGAFVVLLGFRWWAPLVLLVAWHLTNLLFVRATENGVTVQISDGAVAMRRSEYLRSLALDAPAAKEVRVFGLGGWVVGRYADAWMDALRMIWRNRRASRRLTAACTVALALSHAAVLGALAWEAAEGRLSGASLLVFVQAVIASSDLGLLDDWQWFLSQSLAVSARVARLRERVPAAALALAEEPAPRRTTRRQPKSPAPAPAPVRGGKVGLRLENVRFTYRGREKPTLDGLTLEVPAGQSLAIVGENGAGKSTLIKLLCGFYEPDAGRITLDGGLSPLEARGRIGVIFQDFVRYRLPLRENVAFGYLPLMQDTPALEGALRDAGGGALLERLPRGWDTVLTREFRGGTDLSGGQWQRVALARALAAVRGGAGLLILDEPTAALDVRAETELFERFLSLTREVTTLLVSHRLSSVRHADRIVVIDGGRVVEDGTHAELMRAGGLYAEMYSLQAERFATAGAAGEEAAHA